MKEQVGFPCPFPIHSVDRETFRDKVGTDKAWLKDRSKVRWESYPVEEVVDKMYAFIRVALQGKNRVYFNWSEMVMYVEEQR
jgi:hypothetical protein